MQSDREETTIQGEAYQPETHYSYSRINRHLKTKEEEKKAECSALS